MRAVYLLLAIPLCLGLHSCKEALQVHKQPTQVKLDMEDGELKDLKREYFEKLHQAAPDVDWKKVEHDRAIKQHIAKAQLRKTQATNRNEIVTVADGHLSGTWVERGSDNQAGSVFTVKYDAQMDALYLISAGGSLFMGPRDGSDWRVLQQDLRFNEKYLFFNHLPDDGTIIICAAGGKGYYSDDYGASWSPSIGLNGTDGWRIKNAYQINDETQSIYFLYRSDWWSNIKLVSTQDFGSSYQVRHTFNTSDFDNVSITKPHHSDEILLIEQFDTDMGHLYAWNDVANKLDTINMEVPFAFGTNGRANLVANYQDNTEIIYSYNNNNKMYRSTDGGMTWQERGEIPIEPWDVAVFVSSSNPDILFTGGVNAYRSIDGGMSWTIINEWYEYYDNVSTALHADIMDYSQHVTSEGIEFLTISNHGGLSISYDHGSNNENIGLKGLNVSQYYDVSTQPGYDDFVYAGSQDQGFQRGFINSESDEIAPLEQVISGDYGHTVFTKGGSHLWTVYPGGWVSYYPNPTQGGYSDSYDLDSENESVWIPPLMAHPDPTQNVVYLAGGSANGGAGQYIIELRKTPSGITATNLPYDFSNTPGSITAMAISPFDENIWYVAKDSGRIFKSTDGGQSFTQKAFNGPGAHYLYGSDIMPSEIDPEVIYIAGSGYSNPAVYKSTDGGESYTSMTLGLPQTTVFNLATNADETLIFAATEAGPFVFVKETQEWYDISGLSAPNQTYWSVEYLRDSHIARFGTYGRGIWDFKLAIMVSNDHIAVNNLTLHVYPNPASEILNIENPLKEEMEYILSSTDGSIVQKGILQKGNNVLNIQNIPIGSYIISTRSTANYYSTKFVKI